VANVLEDGAFGAGEPRLDLLGMAQRHERVGVAVPELNGEIDLFVGDAGVAAPDSIVIDYARGALPGRSRKMARTVSRSSASACKVLSGGDSSASSWRENFAGDFCTIAAVYKIARRAAGGAHRQRLSVIASAFPIPGRSSGSRPAPHR
jgi:hypothetical protein